MRKPFCAHQSESRKKELSVEEKETFIVIWQLQWYRDSIERRVLHNLKATTSVIVCCCNENTKLHHALGEGVEVEHLILQG